MSGALGLVVCLGALAADPAPTPPATAPAPAVPATSFPPLVPFAAPESATRLERSKAKIDFFTLANHYEGQENGGMCGPTSAVIVMNALRVDNPAITKPVDPTAIPVEARELIPKGYDPNIHRYTQRAFFDDKFTSVKSKEAFLGKPPAPGAKSDGGLQIRQLGDILKANGLDVQLTIVDDKLDKAAAKKAIVDNLGRAGDFVIVNYSRKVLGQKGGGHISPLAAYDQTSDSFLVLDVNPNDGKTWAWVDAAALFAAMSTPDHSENRGFLLVKEGMTAIAPDKKP